MQRRAYVTGAAVAAALLTGLTGCSSGSGDGGGGGDAKPGGTSSSTTTAEPGRYRTLPEPCGAVGHATLRSLLPGLDTLRGDAEAKAYEGQAALTYDTDRRVGCQWRADASSTTHHVNVDFERVVSYDPAVSDDDRAQELYDRMAARAGIPALPDPEEQGGGKPSASASESAADGEADAAKKADKKGKGDESPSDDASSDGSSSEGSDLAPRALDGLGDVAYIDDSATATGLHRGITLVFRTSNVIVTVEYDQWSSPPEQPPVSQALQEKAQRLARELAGRLTE